MNFMFEWQKWRPDVILKLPIFILLFSKNRASFTNHRSSSQKIQSNRVQDIETLTEFQSNKMHEIFVN